MSALLASARSFLLRLTPGGIRGTLIVLFLVAVIPREIVEIRHYYSLFRSQQRGEYRANLAGARAVASAFDAYVQRISFREERAGLLILSSQTTPDEIATLLTTVVGAPGEGEPGVRYCVWVDPAGRVLASNQAQLVGRDVSSQPYFAMVSGGHDWAVSDLVRDDVSGDFVFGVSRSIRDLHGQLHGIVIALMDPLRLGEVVVMDRSPGAAMVLIDGQGRSVYRYPETAGNAEHRDLRAAQPIVGRALSGEEVADTIVGGDGVKRLASYTPIQSIGWVATTSRTERETMAPLFRELRGELTRDAAVALVAFALVMAASQMLMVPIARLKERAVSFRQGEPGWVTVERPSELRELGEAFNRMTAAVEESYQRAAEGKRRLDAIIANTTDGVLFVDQDRRIVSINPALERLCGWTAAEVVGRPCRDVFQTFDRHGVCLCDVECPMRECMETGSVPPVEVSIATKDGARRDLSVSYVYVRKQVDDTALGVAISRDIGKAKEVERLKDGFVSLLSHDLLNPLSVVQAQGQSMLRDAGADEKARQRAEAVLVSSHRMASMIHDLVDSARLESGLLTLRREPVDLKGFIATLMERMRHIVDAGRAVTLDIPPDAPLVSADSERLERILTNLLTNAIKYSPAGSDVRLEVRRSGTEAIISVRDRGPGVAPADRPRIFDRSYRAAGTSAVEGLGLGLYIARMFVEAHGGRIWVNSEPGSGSTFSFSLPVHTQSHVRRHS